MKKEKRTRRLYTEEEKRVHIKQYRMSGLTAYGYSKITVVNRATLRNWINKCSGKDTDMVSCSVNHEEEIFMKKGKNPKADSDLGAIVYASAATSAGASAPAGNPATSHRPALNKCSAGNGFCKRAGAVLRGEKQALGGKDEAHGREDDRARSRARKIKGASPQS